jgi:NADH-quinone oxidoreductase subunit F
MSSLRKLRVKALADWRAVQQEHKPLINIGAATCGRAAGALDTLAAFETERDKCGLDIRLTQVGCLGLCYMEPTVSVRKPGAPSILYGHVDAKAAAKITKLWLQGDDPCPELAIGVEGQQPFAGIPPLQHHPSLGVSPRIIMRNCGWIDPTRFDHYLARAGYEGLEKALQMKPQEVINEVKKAGVRGRGGAGYPTAVKWQICRDRPGDVKYLICNADEGDPGAFMNRALIEGDPHTLLEGLLIGAYAAGASEAIIYIRAEYPLAVERLKLAIRQMREVGLLGEYILGSGFCANIRVVNGAGAFVCGEETALISSVEGKRGMPRPKPPFPAVSGLWGKPTVINNVDTLATVPSIIRMGAENYAQIGTERSKGTKTFALAGKVKNTGLIEVPLGTTLRQIVTHIGGGVIGDKEIKAVQTGGPSGGCIPASKLDTPVDYEALTALGTIMGSGGIIVMDDDTCMVDVARYFLSFTQRESCGKCPNCRLGTKRMLEILEDICNGEGKEGDIERLEALAQTVKTGALCGLGQTAPNPVLTTIRYFRHEYEAHIKDKTCPAGVCQNLITFSIADTCVGCGLCVKACPSGAISGEPKHVYVLDAENCLRCGACREVCPKDAVLVY